MALAWNLGLPWLVIWAVALLTPATLNSHHWLLDGLKDQITLYGFSVHSKDHGFIGLFLPLVLLHNTAYLVTRFIQSRMQLDFLPMIRNVLLWFSLGLLAYLCWISFNRGAKFGDFHSWSLFALPFFAFNLGLAFFVHKDKNWGAAQITALLVCWSPVFSIVSSLAGNHLRPHSLFEEVVIEPGGPIQGWDERSAKKKSLEFLRLKLVKEGTEFEFPSLARLLKVAVDESKRSAAMSADLDPLRQDEVLLIPDHLEEQGWRAQAENASLLTQFCSVSDPKGPLNLSWSKSDSLLVLSFIRCAPVAQWSVQTTLAYFPLSDLDLAKAQRIAEQRNNTPSTLKDVDTRLLKERDWRQRKLGLELISLVNSEDALPLLVHGFYDPDLEVRQAAASGLLSWGSKAEPYLSKALLDENPYMRGDALRILAKTTRHEPHSAVYRMLNDSSGYVRVSAVRALLPFAKDNNVIKTLMAALNRNYEQSKNPETFLEDEFHSELVVTLARSKDVRAANLLVRVLPKELLAHQGPSSTAETAAGLVLREMKTWMGTDYLQSIVRRSTTQSSREKALSVMAHWKKPGDEETYIKALQDEALRPHALGLLKYFDSEAVKVALREIQSEEQNKTIEMQAR